jgi:hypothetical protein
MEPEPKDDRLERLLDERDAKLEHEMMLQRHRITRPGTCPKAGA